MSGQTNGRPTRCSDKFVKYPYPKNLITNYQKDYHNKIGETKVQKNKETFNIEKEHKIINPHRMDLSTTNKVSYKPYQVKSAQKEIRRVDKSDAPCQQKSTYQAEFPHWQNGKCDIYHEKSPQYPFYSLPFKGNSNYQNNYTEQQMKELRRHQQMLQQLGATSSSFKLNHYQPQLFDFETMNQIQYKPFLIANRPQTSKPKVEAVKTKSFPAHFDTYHKKEFIKHNYKVPDVDYIPYP